MVQLYIRLRQPANIGNRIDLLRFMLEEDFCLDEAAVLYQALSPAYISLTIPNTPDLKGGLDIWWTS